MTSEHSKGDISAGSEYPKLIRDNIPEIVEAAEGKEIATRVLELDEFIEYLKKKTIEEAREQAFAETDEHLLEEIGDLEQAVDALLEAKGFTREQLRTVQDAKRAKRGGFVRRLLMLHND